MWFHEDDSDVEDDAGPALKRVKTVDESSGSDEEDDEDESSGGESSDEEDDEGSGGASGDADDLVEDEPRSNRIRAVETEHSVTGGGDASKEDPLLRKLRGIVDRAFDVANNEQTTSTKSSGRYAWPLP